MEKNLLPDDIIVLGEDGAEGKMANLIQNIVKRFCADHRSWILGQMDRRESERLEREEREREEEAARIL